MKHINFILILFTFLSTQSLQAQFELGVFGGVNGGRLSTSDEAPPGIKSTADYIVGLSPGYRFKDKFKILMDITILRQGFESSNRIYGLNLWDKVGYRNTYLEYANQFEYRLAKHFGVSAGGYTSIHLREEEKLGDGNWNHTKNFRFFRNLSFGMTMGLRAYIENITIFMRYDHGFSTVSNRYLSDEGGVPDSDYWNIKFRTIKLGLGYIWKTKNAKSSI